MTDAAPFLVIGRYCPTDVNPETDADEDVTYVRCETYDDAENEILWYPGGLIVRGGEIVGRA